MPKQALLDGTVEDGADLTTYDELTEFKSNLVISGWTITTHTQGKGGYNYFEVQNKSANFKLHVYLKKVMWRHRSDHEKGVQFGADHVTTGFDAPQNSIEKTLVIGIYKRSKFADTLICVWDPFQWGNRGKAFNCFVSVEALAKAFVFGMWSYEAKGSRRVFVFRPEFLYYYLQNLKQFLSNGLPTVPLQVPSVVIGTNFENLPRNKIISGAPGTGKSNKLFREAKEAGFIDANIVRVTFHPNYSYQQFVGGYRPTPIYRTKSADDVSLFGSDRTSKLESPYDMEPLIDYKFVEGPLTKQLVNAILDPTEEPFLLIIEEINRANVSAVFGDFFQLLDRSPDGSSEYSITVSQEFSDFLTLHGINGNDLRFPPNLYIWASMNSADQGVLPLDSAFKRRWSFEYLDIDEMEAAVANEEVVFSGKLYNWNALRRAINEKLKSLSIPEDKLLGPFFLSAQERLNEARIKNKLLLYLKDDVLRHNPLSLFKSHSFSDIIRDYNSGNSIFVNFEMPAEITRNDADLDSPQGTDKKGVDSSN